mgnify:CR=1 FL=1
MASYQYVYHMDGVSKTYPGGKPVFQNIRLFFYPGAKIGVHFHNCEESVMILEGEAVAEIDGQRHHLRAGDTTFIPPNVPHRFLNESDKLMRIFWIYADINASRTMVAMGIEQTIDDEHEKAKRL